MKLFVKTLVCFLIFFKITTAQVGIGNTNPNAMLDISSSNQATPTNTDGILIPKIDSFPTSNPTAAQDGMLVYATGSGTPTKGFYYWNNSMLNWIPIISNDDWKRTGNPGTDASINFIGTTDTQDLSFRTNNIEKIRLTQKGQLEVLNTGNSIFIGENAGANDDLSDNKNIFIGNQSGSSNTTGFHNTYVGFDSGVNSSTGINNSFFGTSTGTLTTGSSNSFFGSFSGNDTTIAFGNSFFGQSSGSQNTEGNNNSFFGRQSGFLNTTGSINVALGNDALGFNQIGDRNVAIGNQAGRGTSGNSKSDGVFIGFQAGMNENNDNKLYIENSSSSSPLIYGEFDNDILRVNGELQVNNPATTGYALPNADGTIGQVLQTNGNGVITFANAPDPDTEWSKTGNAGTNSTTNFIGTTDAQNLSFRTNNVTRMALTQRGNLLLSNPASSIFIGDGGISEDFSIDRYNIGIGRTSLQDNTVGRENIAIGSFALEHHQGGDNNIAIGEEALWEDIGGQNNIAIGYRAGKGSPGTTKSNGVFIGHMAGLLENTDNRLYIESSNANANSALIYGEFDNNLLRTNAQLQVGSPGNVAIDGRIHIFSDAGSAVDINPLVGYVFNEQGLNTDFRVEGNTVTHLLFADAGLDVLKVGRAATTLTANGTTVNGAVIKYTADFEHQNGSLGSAIGIGSSESIADVGLNILATRANFVPSIDNAFDLGLPTLRWDDVRATNGTIQTSDITQKENISKITYGLEEVLQLNPIKFQWKDDYDRNYKLGLSAQQLQQLIPEVVKDYYYEHPEDGTAPVKKQTDLLGVYYSDIIPVLVKAIQEQDEKINSLEERLEALENK